MTVPAAVPPAVPAASASAPSALARAISVDVDAFAAEHWSRTPLLSRAKELPRAFDDLLSPADVDELVADRALRSPFFRTVREGGGLPLPTRTVTAGARRIGDLVDPQALAAQYADGATLVLQSVHRMHPPVARFCRELATELGHPTQCNAYLTPGGEHQGFDYHHDTHDVFVLQVSGRKRWIVYEPVVRLPLPSQPQAGAHLVPEGAEPLLDVELEAGDALYLPRGYVHAALTTDEDSVHLTVGVLSTTWYDVLSDVAALAGRDETFRDALPVQPAQRLGELLPAFLRRTADWLDALPVEDVEQVARRRLASSIPVEPVSLLATAAAVRHLSPSTGLRPRAGLADDAPRRGRPGGADRPRPDRAAARLHRAGAAPAAGGAVHAGRPARARRAERARPGPPDAPRGRRPAGLRAVLTAVRHSSHGRHADPVSTPARVGASHDAGSARCRRSRVRTRAWVGTLSGRLSASVPSGGHPCCQQSVLGRRTEWAPLGVCPVRRAAPGHCASTADVTAWLLPQLRRLRPQLGQRPGAAPAQHPGSGCAPALPAPRRPAPGRAVHPRGCRGRGGAPDDLGAVGGR